MIAEYELARENDERLFVVANKDNECPLHFHRKLEIMYVIEGEKQVICDDKTYILKQDQIFVADSYAMHSYIKSDHSRQVVIVIPNHLLRDFYLLYSNKKFKDCVLREKYICQLLKPTIVGLTEKESNPLLNQGRIDSLLGMLVQEIGLEDRKYQFDQNLIEEVLAYINENYKEEIDLESLSKHFGYSKYYFSRMFNNFLNINITSYLSMVRLQAAIELLKQGKKTVSDAAYEAGFASIQTFYRAVKKNYSYKKVKDLVQMENNDVKE